MNLRDLRYLVAVAEHRHFGKAADACFVSQPTLSTQIKKLENELNVTLIERNNRHILLTNIGEQVVAKAQQVLQTAEEIQNLVKHHHNPEAGKLTLGAIPTLAPYLLPYCMPAIQQSFPELKIFLYEEQTAILIDKLINGKIDAAILALPVEEPTLKTLTLFTEPFLAAIPTHNSLAKQKKIDLQDLIQEDILLLEDGHCLRDQALDLCRRVGTTEIEGFRATSLETLRQMVVNGAGITFMPKLASHSKRPNTDDIQYLPFKAPAPARDIVIAYRASSYREGLLTQIKQIISNEIAPLLKQT